MITDSDMDGIYDAFGVDVTFANPTITGKKGIFTDATETVNPLGTSVEAYAKTLQIRTADIVNVRIGSTATINAVAYKVTDVEHTGTGDSVLGLR